jgi:hypothetical protein
MTLTIKKKPAGMPKKNRVQAREELNIFQSFYGRHAGMQTVIYYNDVMNIMNCDKADALKLMDQTRECFGKKSGSQIMVWEFCEYMEIDELLIQLFLLSVIKLGIADSDSVWVNDSFEDPENNKFISDQIWCVIGAIYYGLEASERLLDRNAQKWIDANPPDPRGIRMYKRGENYVATMFTRDLMRVLGVSERTAQRLLEKTRVRLNKDKRYYVTVEEYCIINEYPEHIMRKKLAEIYGNDDDDDDK